MSSATPAARHAAQLFVPVARGRAGRQIGEMNEVRLHRPLRSFVLAGGLLSTAPGFAQGIPTDEAGFTTYLAKRLRQGLGDAEVGIKGPLTLSIGPIQANLDRIYAYCKTTSAGCAEEIDNYVKAVAESHRSGSAAPTKEAIRVIVRPIQYLQQAQASLPHGAPAPQTRPLVDGLVVVSAIRMTALHPDRCTPTFDGAILRLPCVNRDPGEQSAGPVTFRYAPQATADHQNVACENGRKADHVLPRKSSAADDDLFTSEVGFSGFTTSGQGARAVYSARNRNIALDDVA
jgi:hypothetical protein